MIQTHINFSKIWKKCGDPKNPSGWVAQLQGALFAHYSANNLERALLCRFLVLLVQIQYFWHWIPRHLSRLTVPSPMLWPWVLTFLLLRNTACLLSLTVKKTFSLFIVYPIRQRSFKDANRITLISASWLSSPPWSLSPLCWGAPGRLVCAPAQALQLSRDTLHSPLLRSPISPVVLCCWCGRWGALEPVLNARARAAILGQVYHSGVERGRGGSQGTTQQPLVFSWGRRAPRENGRSWHKTVDLALWDDSFF